MEVGPPQNEMKPMPTKCANRPMAPASPATTEGRPSHNASADEKAPAISSFLRKPDGGVTANRQKPDGRGRGRSAGKSNGPIRARIKGNVARIRANDHAKAPQPWKTPAPRVTHAMTWNLSPPCDFPRMNRIVSYGHVGAARRRPPHSRNGVRSITPEIVKLARRGKGATLQNQRQRCTSKPRPA